MLLHFHVSMSTVFYIHFVDYMDQNPTNCYGAFSLQRSQRTKPSKN